MSVKVRLTRLGCRNTASFRIVATDARSPRDGRYIEKLGWYDPKKKGINFKLDLERVAYWKSQGAEFSETVKSMLRRLRRAEKVAAAPAAAVVAAE